MLTQLWDFRDVFCKFKERQKVRSDLWSGLVSWYSFQVNTGEFKSLFFNALYKKMWCLGWCFYSNEVFLFILKGGVINAYKYLEGGFQEDGTRLFSLPSDRTGGNRQKLKRRKVHLNMRKSCFTVRLAEHWNSLPWKVMESFSQEILKTCLDATLYTLQWAWSSWSPEVPSLCNFLSLWVISSFKEQSGTVLSFWCTTYIVSTFVIPRSPNNTWVRISY